MESTIWIFTVFLAISTEGWRLSGLARELEPFILHKTFIEAKMKSSKETMHCKRAGEKEREMDSDDEIFSCFMITFLSTLFDLTFSLAAFTTYIKLCRLFYELHGKNARYLLIASEKLVCIGTPLQCPDIRMHAYMHAAQHSLFAWFDQTHRLFNI